MMFAVATWPDAIMQICTTIGVIIVAIKQWWDASQRKQIAAKTLNAIDVTLDAIDHNTRATVEGQELIKKDLHAAAKDVKQTTVAAVEQSAAMGSGGVK